MSNQLANFQQAGLPADPAQLKAGIQQARQQAPAGTGGVQYLKLHQNGSPLEGQLTYGAESMEVEEGSEWCINWRALQHGFLLRDGAQVKSEVFASIFEPLPGNLAAPQGQQRWSQAYKAQLACINGEDAGVVVEYSGDAGGVVKLFKQLILPALEAQIDDDPEHLFPVITMDVSSYHSKKQSKDIYELQAEIVRWLSETEMAEIAGAAESDSAAAPVETEAPEPEPAPAEAQPRTAERRRRRASA